MSAPKRDYPESAWEELILRYCPTGKRICNCGQAYSTYFLPETSKTTNISGTKVGVWECEHGFSANKTIEKEIVAIGVLREFSTSEISSSDKNARLIGG